MLAVWDKLGFDKLGFGAVSCAFGFGVNFGVYLFWENALWKC